MIGEPTEKITVNAEDMADGQWRLRYYCKRWHERLRWKIICALLKSLQTTGVPACWVKMETGVAPNKQKEEG